VKLVKYRKYNIWDGPRALGWPATQVADIRHQLYHVLHAREMGMSELSYPANYPRSSSYPA